jgi:effector-binding domain-containing protein
MDRESWSDCGDQLDFRRAVDFTGIGDIPSMANRLSRVCSKNQRDHLMLEAPQIVQSIAQLTAFIHLTIPRHDIQNAMGPAMGELMATIAAQGIAPAGPVFSHHLKMTPDIFDFEVSVPVATAVVPTGRVKSGQMPPRKVARTVYQGPYEGLGLAWGEFNDWIAIKGFKADIDLWECYLTNPNSNPDPSTYRTELNSPLLD